MGVNTEGASENGFDRVSSSYLPAKSRHCNCHDDDDDDDDDDQTLHHRYHPLTGTVMTVLLHCNLFALSCKNNKHCTVLFSALQYTQLYNVMCTAVLYS